MANTTDGFLFPHSVEVETREPLFTVSIPAVLGEPLFGGPSDQPTELGLVLPSSLYWLELMAFLLIVICCFAFTGFLLYKTVIEPRKQSKMTTATNSEWNAYLIGFGMVLPYWMVWPMLLLRVVDIRNAVFRFLLAGILPVLSFFRSVEVVCDLCPSYTTRSQRDFLFYFMAVPIPDRAKQPLQLENGTTLKVGDPIPCSTSQKQTHLSRFLGFLVLTGALQSVLTPHHNLILFGRNSQSINAIDDRAEWYASERYGTWQLYGNSALHAMLFQLYLCTYIEALSLVFAVVTGFRAESAMDNPLLRSRSVIEFWGKRWNRLVHTVLKNGVYKPLRKCCGMGSGVAIVATFLMSGAFHEWLVWTTFAARTNHSDRSMTFDPSYGGSMVFFVWQALLMGLEMMASNTSVGQAVAAKMPTPLRTFLVVAAGIPPAHFFLEAYARSNFFFSHGAAGLPMLLKLSSS